MSEQEPDTMLRSIRIEGLIKKGAEASVYRASWHRYNCVFKERVPKLYRNSLLDLRLREERTKKEARLLHQIKEMGIRVPYLYHVDLIECSILMEYINGRLLKDVLIEAGRNKDVKKIKNLLKAFGNLVGRLHTYDFIHGDLTTSNVVLKEEEFELVLIDFGLGYKSKEIEDKGVDLHVLLEAFESTHSDILQYKNLLLKAYRESYFQAEEVIKKSEEIERRGRYR